ncbi:MAG: nuclear transport factor 2 family protein [Chitinophagaceae bacterium]|nr:nuclear transport factor 2 family protein [Chitinophagaceae bacterium]
MTREIINTFLLLLITASTTVGQNDKKSPLFLELKQQDSLFFERSFNQCDIAYLESRMAQDLKFYHDQSGFQDRTKFFENIKQYICASSTKKPIRKVDANSLEVFPLYNNGKLYGAIQMGIHLFYIREQGKTDVHSSTAKFTHVWLMEDGIWKLSEVLSYDHREPATH